MWENFVGKYSTKISWQRCCWTFSNTAVLTQKTRVKLAFLSILCLSSHSLSNIFLLFVVAHMDVLYCFICQQHNDFAAPFGSLNLKPPFVPTQVKCRGEWSCVKPLRWIIIESQGQKLNLGGRNGSSFTLFSFLKYRKLPNISPPPPPNISPLVYKPITL